MPLSVALAMALLVPPQPPPQGTWWEIGAGLELRRGVQLAESLELRGGLLRPSGLRIGGGVAVSPLRELPELGEVYAYRGLSAFTGAWWQADGGWAPGLGVTLGAGAYAFQGPSGKVDTVFVPRLGAESSLAIPLRDSVTLIVRVTLAGDLRRVRLFVDEVPVADLSPWALQAGFGLRFGP